MSIAYNYWLLFFLSSNEQETKKKKKKEKQKKKFSFFHNKYGMSDIKVVLINANLRQTVLWQWIAVEYPSLVSRKSMLEAKSKEIGMFEQSDIPSWKPDNNIQSVCSALTISCL